MSKSKKYLKVINEIEKVRSKNNKNWMNILRISFKYAPKESVKIFSQIYKEDRKLNNLAKKLTNLI